MNNTILRKQEANCRDISIEIGGIFLHSLVSITLNLFLEVGPDEPLKPPANAPLDKTKRLIE